MTKIINFFTTKLATEANFNEICKLAQTNETENDLISQIQSLNFATPQELSIFLLLIDSLYDNQPKKINLSAAYVKCVNVFTKANFEMFQAMSNNDYENYNDMIEIFSNNFNWNFDLKPHPNIKIITCTDRLSEATSFSSIRINETIKVYPGLPGMSEFIRNVFMKLDGTDIDFDQIVKNISNDGKSIEFPARLPEQEKGTQRMQEWMHLKPQIYENGNVSISFTPCMEFLKEVQKLRVATYQVSALLKDISHSIAPNIETIDPNTENEFYGDIVALMAIMNQTPREYHKELMAMLSYPNLLKGRSVLGQNQIFTLIRISLEISKDPIRMAAVTLNCICGVLSQAAIYIMESVNSMEGNSVNCPIDDKEREKYEYSILALMNKKTEFLFFPSVVAALLLKEGTVSEVISSVGNLFQPALQYDRLYVEFMEEIESKSEIDVITIAQRYMLVYAMSYSEYVKNVGKAHSLSDLIWIAVRDINSKYTALSVILQIKLRIESKLSKDTENIIFKAIASVPSECKVSDEFYPVVISAMKKNDGIRALVIALYENDNNNESFPSRFDEAIQKLGNEIYIKNVDDVYNGSVAISTIIDKVKNDLMLSAKLCSEKVKRLSTVLYKSAIMNVSRRMPLDYMNRIRQTKEMISKIPIQRFNQLNEYIGKAINKMDFFYGIQRKIVKELPETPFPDPQKLLYIDDIIQSAAKELLTASNALSIVSPDHITSITKDAEILKGSTKEREIGLNVIIARIFSISEMSPIVQEISRITNMSIAAMPVNVDEIMATMTATRHSLNKKDRNRIRRRHRDEGMDTIEIDEYYSPGYYEDYEAPFRRGNSEASPYSSAASSAFASPNSSPSMRRGSPSTSSSTESPVSSVERILMGEDYGGNVNTRAIDKLDVGNSIWYEDAWRVFVFCFNERIKELGIEFDPSVEYTGISANLSYCYNKVLEFYPISRIRRFPKKFGNLCRFVGQNRSHTEELCDAFVKAFDDTDQTVTPYYFDRLTFSRDTIVSYF